MNNTSEQLDHDLDQYTTAARATLKLKGPARHLGELALYTAAVGSALALAPGADASIIYSGIRNITLHRVSDADEDVAINLGGFGNGVSLFIRSYSTGGPFTGAGPSQADIAGLSPLGSLALIDPGFFLENFPASTNIGYSKFSFTARTSPGYGIARSHQRIDNNDVSNGEFGTGFAAARVSYLGNGSGTAPHYGWLHLKVDVGADKRTDAITLIDWAFESVPNTSIHVGDRGISTPEPSGLGLMALGAIGIAALRRRRLRNRKANPPQ